ncbi:MAG: hypothetical protein VX672_01685, partial [Planctomycetota bacterium]|nr:hypothetical protein [Planctomycetota bacterium]
KAVECDSSLATDNDALWKQIMLMPEDYADEAIFDDATRALMDKIEFEHGGEEYDRRYPDGIPTSIVIRMKDNTAFDSELVMYPSGHARNTSADLKSILGSKFQRLGDLCLEDAPSIIDRMNNLPTFDAEALRLFWDFEIKDVGGFS